MFFLFDGVAISDSFLIRDVLMSAQFTCRHLAGVFVSRTSD